MDNIHVLLEDAQSGDPQKVTNSVYTLIAIGHAEGVSALIEALESFGDIPMAETFLNSGNEALASAAGGPVGAALRHVRLILAGIHLSGGAADNTHN